MATLKKTQFIPFIDTSATGNTPVWTRIDRSTIFSLNAGTQTETLDYISMETPVTEVTSYQPTLPQEIAVYEGNGIYDFMIGKFYNLETGSGAKVKCLICFGGEDKKAWECDETTLELQELNTVEGKLTFTLHFGGDITKGTYTIAEGVPTFTAG